MQDTKDKNRINYVNALFLQIGDNDVVMRLGIALDPNHPEKMEGEQAMIMTPKTAKLLMTYLQNGLLELEKKIGPINIGDINIQPILLQEVKPKKS